MKRWIRKVGIPVVVAAGVAAPGRARSAPPQSHSFVNDALHVDDTREGAREAGVGKTPEGRPDVHLDHLEFPSDLRESAALKKHLLSVLKREVRRVEWGAGRENRIEYRYSVTKLSLKLEGDVLHVTCTSVGKLPGGRTAKSHLSFGGAPRDRYKLLKNVLEIVARGVVSRLAELERTRRGLSG
jgi:hypothetical protein